MAGCVAAVRCRLLDVPDGEVPSRHSTGQTMYIQASSNSKKPRRDSLAGHVIAFLEANPQEELTRHDIAAKFDIDPVQVDDLIRKAVTSGHLVRELNTDSVAVWRLNYSRNGVPQPFAVGAASAKKARRERRKSPVVIDFESLVIEEGIPLVENRPKKNGLWGNLFDQMKPGTSVLFKLEARDALSHAQFAYRKNHPKVKFTVRKVGVDHCRIWRLEDTST